MTAIPEDSRHRGPHRGDRDAAAGQPPSADAREAAARLAAGQSCPVPDLSPGDGAGNPVSSRRDAVHSEHLNQSGKKPAPAADAGISWPEWLPPDGSAGVPHFKPGTEEECRFKALGYCGRCDWSDPDPSHMEAALRLWDVARQVLGD